MVQSLDEARRRSRPASGARTPPHDLQAEESLLGAMLMSRDAIATAVEHCVTDDFYKPAHGHVFDAVCNLYSHGEPVDPVTVADELRRAGLLEAIGGPALLISLQAATPATSSAGRYARIVSDHALLRKLISVAGEITEIGYDIPEDVHGAIDRAESMVFDVAQRRVADTLAPLRDLLSDTLDRLEALYDRGEAITGVPTGYTDLDEQLSGLQPSNLVIVGARPAAGKALALDTPLPTPGGWTTMGQVAVGDLLLDEHGRPCRIEYVSPVFTDHRCYRVEFDDGTAVVADAGHRWLVHRRPAEGPSPVIATTEEMAAGGIAGRDGGPAWHIPLTGPVDLPEVDLPVDPFLLGCRLGTRFGAGPPAGDLPAGDPAADDLPAGDPAADGPHAGDLPVPGTIPSAYLRGSAKQRLALLQGLMDMAGSVDRHHGTVELGLTRRDLAVQVREIVCSLGHRPGPLEERLVPLADGGAAALWCLRWCPPDQVFRMPLKARRLAGFLARHPHRAPVSRAVTAVEEVDTVPVRCVSVSSPGHLFLAGESMVPTHNTAFALGAAAHAAMEARQPVLFFSLEMSHLEISQRLLCAEARVDATRVRNGKLQDSDWSKISHAIGRLGEAPIFIDDNPNLTVMDIRAKARRLKSREGLGLVVVDYLQLMTGRSAAENRQVEVSEISRGLKILARELEVPVVALSQLSRNLEQRADKRPMLADLRESGSLEQDADVVMFIYRDEVYNPESPDRGTAEIIVAKHRNGPTGTARLAFLDHYARFANMARGN